MKVHRYQVKVYDGALAWSHGMHETQERLYMPGKGVFAYRNKEKIDFFSDDKKALNEAESIIGDAGNGKYLGEIELPDDIVLKAISSGKKLNNAKENFQKDAKSLVERVLE